MRFTIFGQGEGVRGEGNGPLWASVRENSVTDASIAAKKYGIRPRMLMKTAQALLPSLIFCTEEDLPTKTMGRVWELLWSHSPWLETVDKDAFYLQVPGVEPPFREVQGIIRNIDAVLTEQQRFRTGFAENPFLSRALVEWSRVERVPVAQYYKIGRQQWVISPSLAGRMNPKKAVHSNVIEWMREFPVQALWTLPDRTRNRLLELGILRLGQLRDVSMSMLQSHFGKEVLLWIRLLEQAPGGTVAVNYPPLCRKETWQSEPGEDSDIRCLEALVQQLLERLSKELERSGAGAQHIKFVWKTNQDHGEFERYTKRPAWRQEELFAAIQPAFQKCIGIRLEQLEIQVDDIRPLATIQTSFVMRGGQWVSSEAAEKEDLQDLMRRVNRKFPRKLQIGLQPQFREMRLNAVAEYWSRIHSKA